MPLIPPGSLGEVVKRLRVDNALPYILLGMFALSGWLFYLATTAAGSIAGLLGAAALLTLVAGGGLTIYVAVWRPGQLRTERHEEIMRFAEMLESSDFDEATQRALGPLIEQAGGPTTSRGHATSTRNVRKPL